MKVWDLGGQVQYRSEWGTYTKGCDAIIFVTDAGHVTAICGVNFIERIYLNSKERTALAS